MHAERQNRTIQLTDLPATVEGLNSIPAMEIEIRYKGDTDKVGQAIVLDNLLLPIIVAALNAHRAS